MTIQRPSIATVIFAVWLGCSVTLTGCMEAAVPKSNQISFDLGGPSSSKVNYASPIGGQIASPPPTSPISSGGMAAGGQRAIGGSTGSLAAPATAGSGGMAGNRVVTGGSVASGAGGTGLVGPGGMTISDGSATPTVADVPAKPAGPTDGTLAIAVTPLDMRGIYSPANCGAVWVETMAGEFVKTTEHWCGFRSYYLRRWTKASGGWGGGFGRGFGQPAMMPTNGDMTDAVASATLRSYAEHKSMWKLRNAKGDLVPDGDYRVVIEVSEGPGPMGDSTSKEFPFKKGPEAMKVMAPDVTPLKGVSLDYQPHAAP